MRSPNYESISIRTAPPLIRLISRWFYAKAEVIIALTQAMSIDLKRNFNVPDKNIRVIPNPIDLRQIQELYSEPVDHPWFNDEIRKKFPIIIAVGGLVKAKGFPHLLKAFAKVRETLRARLVILGKGEKLQELKYLSEDLNIAQDTAFLGFANNPYKYMAKSDLFVLSSLWEGFPNVLVEAMACGTPVISTNCPSGPDEIITHGANGLLVPPADHEALAESILKLLNDERMRHSLSDAARKKVVDYDVTNIIREYEELFIHVAEG